MPFLRGLVAKKTVHVDSTICETHGLVKEGARHHGYTGQIPIARIGRIVGLLWRGNQARNFHCRPFPSPQT